MRVAAHNQLLALFSPLTTDHTHTCIGDVVSVLMLQAAPEQYATTLELRAVAGQLLGPGLDCNLNWHGVRHKPTRVVITCWWGMCAVCRVEGEVPALYLRTDRLS